MKVIVATTKTQGQRKNDFSWATEGELVGFGSECDGEAVDGKCGCRRAFSGLESRKATTTAEVVEREMTMDDLVMAVHTSLESGGWLNPEHISHEEAMAWVTRDATELAQIAESFEVGMVIEKRGNKIQQRLVA